jgi:hypothetical protein
VHCIGKEAVEEESLTTEGLGMKIGEALKVAIASMADKKLIVESITAALGVHAVVTTTPSVLETSTTPPRNNIRMAPFVTPNQPIDRMVEFDAAKFYTDLKDGDTPVPASTAWTHKWRAKHDVNAALNRHGTLEHQAAIIHDICTVGPKAGIGVALGILDNPEQHASVVEHLFQDTFEVLHCDRVLGRNNTQAIEFTHNTFLATAPTAPPENATVEEKKAYRQKLNNYCDEMQLTAGMRKKAQNAGIRRREILYADNTQVTLTYEWKRKSPSDKKLTPGMIEAVQEWLFSSCKLVDPSPNKRDEVYTKDDETGEKYKVRKYHYKFSIRQLYNEFKKPVILGGFDGFRDEKGEMKLHPNSFRKCMPKFLKKMTESQKEMLGCEICIDAEVMHNALMEWRTRRLCHFTETLAKLEAEIDTLEQAQFVPEVTLTAGEEEDLARLQDTYLEVFYGRQKYLETVFQDDEGLLQKQRTIKDVLDGMTCQPVGGSGLGNDFHHYNSCLGRCKNNGCGNFEPPPGENDRTGRGPGSMITWSRYEYNYKCYRHGHIGRNSQCTKCEELPPEQL